MSEYQYFEFQAIDRPLTAREMGELRKVSTRATITPTRFTNHYEWGDFKGNPSKWMEKYFDAFLYVTNWGAHEFMLRLPKGALDIKTAKRYCRGESAEARAKGDCVILEFRSDDENGDNWDDSDDGSGWLSSLITLRRDLAAGDHRALYLAWLFCVQNREVKGRDTEPPVPPGLGKLSAPLKSFADFLRIDTKLIAVAAERSAQIDDKISAKDLERWIDGLAPAEKTALLRRFVTGDEQRLRSEVLRRFQRTQLTGDAKASGKPRTAQELLDRVESRAAENGQKLAS